MWIYYLLSLCFSRIHFFLLLHLVFLHDVKAAVKDRVETVEVTEGASVTLRTDLTGIRSDEMIRWTFGATDTRIAQLLSGNTFTDYDERFKTRLRLDKQIGSLTISNIRTSDSGPYKVHISSDQVTNKHFSVTVYATLPVPNITQKSSQSQSQSKSSSGPRCSAVCSVRNAYKVTLSWYNGSGLLSSISGSENSILSLPLDFDHGDNNTYICVAANPITNRTAQLNMSCTWYRSPNESSRLLQWLIPVLVVLLLVLVAVYLLYRKSNFSKNTPRVCETSVSRAHCMYLSEEQPCLRFKEEPFKDTDSLLTFVTYCSVNYDQINSDKER